MTPLIYFSEPKAMMCSQARLKNTFTSKPIVSKNQILKFVGIGSYLTSNQIKNLILHININTSISTLKTAV